MQVDGLEAHETDGEAGKDASKQDKPNRDCALDLQCITDAVS